jgi:hypothetical protein
MEFTTVIKLHSRIRGATNVVGMKEVDFMDGESLKTQNRTAMLNLASLFSFSSEG